MTQTPPRPPDAQAMTRFFIGFALIEGALLAAILLAMVFEVITPEQMIPLLIAVALVGGAVMTWRILSYAKQRQSSLAAPASTHQVPDRSQRTDLPQAAAGESRPGDSGLDGLGEKDPMAKYRDPNR